MRQIISITQLTLDGVMQSPGGPEEDPRDGFPHGGWAMGYGDEVFMEELDKTLSGEFAMLLGGWTWRLFASYWPQQENSIATAFNGAPKYAVTRRPEPLEPYWANSHRIDGDHAVDEIRALKATDGPDLHIWGSSQLLQTLITADLIDEYRLWIVPAVLGQGRRLFETGVPPRGLALVSTRSTPSGVLFNHYRPAGAIKSR